uniref:Uncharacterized protein n=1 Tax=Cacopsylla melanoneura TaxID=428564 RepID=A0A8D9EF19_9HEMI
MQVISISLDIICIERDWLGILHYPRVSKKIKMPSKTWTSKQIRVNNFIDVLLDFQCEVYVKSRSSRPRINVKEKFVKQEMSKLEEKQIDRFQFVKRVSYKFLPKV